MLSVTVSCAAAPYGLYSRHHQNRSHKTVSQPSRADSRHCEAFNLCSPPIADNSVNMPVTLYAFPPLPNPQKALLALEEFGIPYTVKTVNVVAAENLTPNFLSLNANGTLPVLVVPLDGQQQKVITESSEIVLNAAARGRSPQTCDIDLVKRWVFDFDSWNGPLYTLAHDAVLKKILLSVDAYKIQLSEARQHQYPALKEAYSRAAARYRQAGKALTSLFTVQS